MNKRYKDGFCYCPNPLPEQSIGSGDYSSKCSYCGGFLLEEEPKKKIVKKDRNIERRKQNAKK